MILRNMLSIHHQNTVKSRLVISFAILLSVNSLFSCVNDDPIPVPDNPVTLDCVKPDYLKAGDKVALISPSYFTPMENVEKTAEVLRGWGFEPVIAPNVGKIADGKYAGTVAERVADVRWALQDPSIKAIICNKGGYGSIQLIDQLSLPEFKEARKWMVGFSDFTTFHGLSSRAGVMSLQATMSTFLAAGGTDATSTLMRDILLGIIPEYHVPAHPQNILGTATGTLVGGNICTLAPNVGTQADATLADNLILFVEEIGESMRNIDRQMRILEMNGVLDRCRGVILGEFTGCGTEFTDGNGQIMSVEAMLREMLAPYNIPVLCGFPAGHDNINLPLVMGAPVTIDVRSGGSTIRFGIEGQMREIQTSDIPYTKTPLVMRMELAGKIRNFSL